MEDHNRLDTTAEHVLNRYLESWAINCDHMSVEEWLKKILTEDYPEYAPETVDSVKDDILSTLEQIHKARASLTSAVAQGRSKESWFAKEILKATSRLGMQGTVQYLSELDGAIQAANDSILSAATYQ